VSACAFCGPAHPTGLHVRFVARDGRVTTSFLPRRRHQGFHGLMSGGLLAGIFDCLHYRIPVLHGVPHAVTARVEVHYRAPIPLGRRVRFEAALVARRGRVFDTRAWAWLPDGTLAAESTAVYVEVPAERLPPAARRPGPGRGGVSGRAVRS
jgi:acyl-coenzyme A thioesterase PaaI-like protein